MVLLAQYRNQVTSHFNIWDASLIFQGREALIEAASRKVKVDHLNVQYLLEIWIIFRVAKLYNSIELIVTATIINDQVTICILLSFDLLKVQVLALRIVEEFQLARPFGFIFDLKN